jgi:murein DD-endopeptidase MepM/ murein hydrolase activator NlpD
MYRSRALAVVVIASAVLGALGPARAQEPPTTDPAQPTTTIGLPSTLVPTSLPALPPPPPTTAPIADDPDAGGDAPPEAVPQDDTAIPPRTEYASPGSLPPPRGQVVKIDVRRAREKSEAADADLAKATATRVALENEIHRLNATLDKFDKAGRQAIIDLAAAKRQLTTRAVDAYIRGTDSGVGIDRSGMTDEELLQSALLGAVLGRDDAAVATYERLKKAATAAQAKVAAALAKGQDVLNTAVRVEQQATRQAEQAKFALAVTAAGGNIVIYGFVFPVAPPYKFSDSFGAPRLTGTDLEHWHQGVDIAAAEGTELYAAERGVITQISPSQLGGNGLWIRGESGVSYYYAHLSRYADVHAGQLVEAGDLVGYVGNTGLFSTGPHLHFEVHPNGGDAINPYPLLVAADPSFGPGPGT